MFGAAMEKVGRGLQGELLLPARVKHQHINSLVFGDKQTGNQVKDG